MYFICSDTTTESFMKTKIASFLTIAALSLLTLATGAFADAEEGFYEKDHVRGFISIGADYRGMRKEFQNYVNTVAFSNWGHLANAGLRDSTGEVTSDTLTLYQGAYNYNKFNSYYLGLHVNIGAQYKQFLTWFDINFMPSQTSERKKSSYTAYNVDGTDTDVKNRSYPLYDVEWFSYGADWMFGWKLFGENSFINLIPAVGFGFNLINFHFASNFTIHEMGNRDNYAILRDRFYSVLASTVTAEMEFRLDLGRLALGAYGGYRFVRYNDLELENFNIDYDKNGTDNVGDTWYLGLRATWYFLSSWEKKQADKL